MPACNAGKYIGEAIRSVLAQTYTDFELLIIDDGSTDDTRTVVRQFPDKRIRLIKPAVKIFPGLNRYSISNVFLGIAVDIKVL